MRFSEESLIALHNSVREQMSEYRDDSCIYIYLMRFHLSQPFQLPVNSVRIEL